jgi:diacylglycerol kinase family enzyme
MRAVLFHNPTAGTKSHSKSSILAALRLAQIEVRYVSTEAGDVKAALENDADLVVIAGGDGTVGMVLTGMPDRSVPVGILPLGTANNIARSLGIAGTPQELVESWRTDHICRFDIGAIRGPKGASLFIEAVGIGLLPEFFSKTAAKKKVDGADSLRKGRAALRRVLEDAKPIDVAISVDGQPFGDEVLGVEVLNIAYTGPGLPLATAADPGDGLLDVICFEASQRGALLDWIEAPHRGRPPVRTRQGAKVKLEWRNVASRIDDEILDQKTNNHPLKIACEKQPARILMPVVHPAPRAHRQRMAHA